MVLSTGAQQQIFRGYTHVAVLSVSESTRQGKRISCLEHEVTAQQGQKQTAS